MNLDYQHEFQNWLDSGEYVTWSGRPPQGIQFSKHDIFLVPFSILWAGFAIFWEASVLYSGAPMLFKLWGIPFVIVGVYFVVGRFVHDKFNRNRTFYAITNKRIAIKKGSRFESMQLGDWPMLKLDEDSNGSGTIHFSEPSRSGFGSRNQPLKATPSHARFFRIPDARSVFKTLNEKR